MDLWPEGWTYNTSPRETETRPENRCWNPWAQVGLRRALIVIKPGMASPEFIEGQQWAGNISCDCLLGICLFYWPCPDPRENSLTAPQFVGVEILPSAPICQLTLEPHCIPISTVGGLSPPRDLSPYGLLCLKLTTPLGRTLARGGFQSVRAVVLQGRGALGQIWRVGDRLPMPVVPVLLARGGGGGGWNG